MGKNYFQFEDKILQTVGLGMGVPTSAILSEAHTSIENTKYCLGQATESEFPAYLQRKFSC
jgi:hypothetical protein